MSEYSLALSGLFFSAFISSTIAPGGSEAVLAALVSGGLFNPWLLVGVATIGNTLGAMTTLWLGKIGAARFKPTDVIPAKNQRTLGVLRQYGVWALLFSWLPLVGDGLCFAAGWLSLPFLWCTIVIFIGKIARYAVVAALFGA